MFLCWVNCYAINGYTVSYPTPGHRFLAMAQSSGYCIGCIFPNFEAWAVLHGLIYGKVQPWTQEDGGTPYYGPLPETMEQGTPLEPGTPMETPIPPTQPDKEDGEQGHHDGESSELPPSQQLSYSAVDKRLRRIMTPRANGDLKVPQQVIDQWKNKNTRPDVMSLFEKSGYQPDWVRVGSVQILVGFVFIHRMFGALQSIFCYLSNKTLNLWSSGFPLNCVDLTESKIISSHGTIIQRDGFEPYVKFI